MRGLRSCALMDAFMELGQKGRHRALLNPSHELEALLLA